MFEQCRERHVLWIGDPCYISPAKYQELGDEMSKVMKCGDLMPGCDFVARGETDSDILQAAAAHAKEVHHLDATPELVQQVKSVIKDE